jgi:2-polyprenyl-3-methyl-5-hydroxy-6-metoxy-1,4-benzoquinol methylase
MLLLEVVELVERVGNFVAQARRDFDLGGLVFFSTINGSLRSFFVAICRAEYNFRVLPVGTHR